VNPFDKAGTTYKSHIGNPDIISVSPSGKKIHWLLTSEIGSPNFEMWYIEIPSNAKPSKTASHPYEHEVYVVPGHGCRRESMTARIPKLSSTRGTQSSSLETKNINGSHLLERGWR
jgi:hypothetical protein